MNEQLEPIMEGNVIGIDPGTKCGWAVIYENGHHKSGVWNLATKRHQGGGMRYVNFKRAFASLIGESLLLGPCVVYYEEVRRHAGTSAAHTYGGIVAMLVAVCEEDGVPYTSIPVGTVKKFATTKGNASKEMMIAAAKVRWPGFEPVDDNEADARWIAEAGLNGL